MSLEDQTGEIQISLSADEGKMVAVLAAQRGELHGYEIGQRLKGKVPHSAIYVYLNRLEKKGVITSRIALTKLNGLRVARRFVKLRPNIRTL